MQYSNEMAAYLGIGPRTLVLTAPCSAAELIGNKWWPASHRPEGSHDSPGFPALDLPLTERGGLCRNRTRMSIV